MANVNLYLQDFVTNPLAVKQVVFKQTGSAVQVSGSYIITKDEIAKYTNGVGYINLTNMVSGFYSVSVQGKNKKTEFTILVPNDGSEYNAKDLLANATGSTANQAYYYMTASNATNAVSASYLSGSNILIETISVPLSTSPIKIGNNAGSGSVGNSMITIGYRAGMAIQENLRAVSIGADTAQSMITNSLGVQVGYRAGFNAGHGTYSTMIGAFAGQIAKSASYATFIGGNTGPAISTTEVSKSIAIGYNAKVSQSNQCAIGGKVGSTYEVKVGIGTDNPTERLHVSGSILVDNGSLYGGVNATTLEYDAPTFDKAIEFKYKAIDSDEYMNPAIVLRGQTGATTLGTIRFANSQSSVTSSITFDDGGALNLDAGTVNIRNLRLSSSVADVPPLKLQAASSLIPTVQPGSMEYYNNAFWLSNLVVRRSIVQAINVLTASLSASNSTSEFLLYTVPHGANYMKAGKMEEINLYGLYSSVLGAGNNALTVRVKWVGATVASFTTVEGAFTNAASDLHCTYTCRDITNNTGSIFIHAGLDIDGVANDPDVTTSASFNSTQAADLTITAQWSDAASGNTFVVNQGRALCIN